MFPEEGQATPIDIVNALSGGNFHRSEYSKMHVASHHFIRRSRPYTPNKVDRFQVSKRLDDKSRKMLLAFQQAYVMYRHDLLNTCRAAWGEFRDMFIRHDSVLPIAERSLVSLDQFTEKNIAKQVKLLQLIAMFRIQQQSGSGDSVPREYSQVLARMSNGESYSAIHRNPNAPFTDEQMMELEKSFATKALTILEKKRLCLALKLPLSRINQW